MQNKGFVKVFAILLALVCAYYLSFTIVTNHVENKAEKTTQGDPVKLAYYLDSMKMEKVYLGMTYEECRNKVINLGLDLKGGMNVTLELSIPDVIKTLSNNNPDPKFKNALAAAKQDMASSQADFVDLFVEEYRKVAPGARLSAIFGTFELKDKISPKSTDAEVIKVIKDEVESAIDNSFNVLRTRIDRFGVVQPNIQRLEQKGRILIELPGVKEPERVRKLLQGSANLEFWETYEFGDIYQSIIEANNIIRDLNAKEEAEKSQSDDTVSKESKTDEKAKTPELKTKEDELLSKVQAEDTTKTEDMQADEWKKQYPLFAVLQLNQSKNGVGKGPVVGYAFGRDTSKVNKFLSLKKVREVLPRDLKFVWSVNSVDPKVSMFELIALKVTNREGKPALGGNVITDANDDFQRNSGSAKVNMKMNAEGSKIWARLTKDNIGKSIAIVLDGYAYSYPRVQGEITGGSSEITGNFTAAEAKDLANVLKSGRMPAPAHIVQEDIVGPSLGHEAIRAGFISFVIAFILVLIYMQLSYGLRPGLIVDVSLLINMFFIMGILASFQAVLTLPGIAGIVLTLGMAVDANVLIYERIKEEVKGGKSIKRAVTDGYNNALSAIIDGNVTTLLTGIVLFTFGTGPIKGFATTLIIGILSSVFCGVFITRIIFEHFLDKDKLLDEHFTTKLTKNLLSKVKFDFIGKRKIGYIISIVIIGLGVVSLFVRGLNKGVDFSGGRNYIVRFDKDVLTNDIRSSLESDFGEASFSVITIGSKNQVRISTNYKIKDNSETVDDEVEALLYKDLKGYYSKNITKEEFVANGIVSSQKVGPTVADDVKMSAIWSVLIALIIIGLYILMRFRNISFSAGAIVALIHDSMFIIGMFSIFSGILPFSLEVDQTFIAAILTIIGYSINDTVVIFDRIRETMHIYPNRDRKSVINDSLNATLLRTFSTSLSTLIVLVAILLFGGDTIRGFVFALTIGVISGTYSSLFIASPIAYEMQKKQLKNEEKK